MSNKQTDEKGRPLTYWGGLDKNMSNKKLYTEEQLHNTVKAIQNYLDHYDEKEAQENIEKHLKALKPIELPSDEEIEDNDIYDLLFIEGAKWMRNKIGGKNEQ